MSHDQIWHMIPWYVNGRAENEQREQVEAHMRVCNECRNEVMAQQQIRDAIANDKRIDTVPGVAFQRLWERITKEESGTPEGANPLAESPAPARAQRAREPDLPTRSARAGERITDEPAPRRARASTLTHWLAAAVIIEAIGITVLAVVLRSNEGVEPPTGQFRTVASAMPATARGDIRAVFSPDAPMSELQRLLEQSGLQIVAGPTEAGVYTLASTTAEETPAATDSQRDTALAGLRASQAVRFAEPISR
jgi:hypothetical protein